MYRSKLIEISHVEHIISAFEGCRLSRIKTGAAAAVSASQGQRRSHRQEHLA